MATRSDPPSPRLVLLQDVVDQARGPKYLGIYRNVWIFLFCNAAGFALALACKTYLLQAFTAAVDVRGSLNREQAYVGLLVILYGILGAIYQSLYGSDPGWITKSTSVSDPQDACQWCGICPSLRSRHDHNTGQCVHKFDHFCWMLGTAIGDQNHLRFWCFVVTQTALILWGLVLFLHSLIYCQDQCWGNAPWRFATIALSTLLLFAALNVFVGLVVLHSYLAATEQTTYEVMRGARVPYLQSFYANYTGPKQTTLLGRDLLNFVSRVMAGKSPPAPFSSQHGGLRGVAENLDSFFFARKPKVYQYQVCPDERII